MTWESRYVSVVVARPVEEVTAFAGDPANLPSWAAGLASGVRQEGDDWIADSPMGEVRLRFAPPNPWGVLDHDVTAPDGTVFHNPLRVLPNDGGSEIVFTVFRRPGIDAADFERDAGTVRADLERLRDLLEGAGSV